MKILAIDPRKYRECILCCRQRNIQDSKKRENSKRRATSSHEICRI